MRSLRTLSLGLLAVSVVPLVACGSDRVGLPTSPSSTPLMTSLTSATTAVELPFEEATAGSRMSTQTSGSTESAPLTVTSLVSGTACPTLQFMINTYLIKTDASTKYEGGSCSHIQAGTNLSLVGTLSNQEKLLFYATQVKLRSTTSTTPKPEPTPTARPVETEATVASVVGGVCPALQFTLSGWSGYTFHISASTVVSGGACSDVTAGAKVHIVGTKTDGVATVTKLTLIKRSDKDPAPTSTAVSGDAVVASLVGGTSCPSLSFMLGTYKASVSAATVYENGTCTDIKAGSALRLAGTKQSDGTIIVSKLSVNNREKEKETKPTQYAEGEGVISGLGAGTACPTLQFMIGTYAIKVDAATGFDKGACGDLRVGAKVAVKGTVNTDGSVTATRVSVYADALQVFEAEGEGVVSSLVTGTLCPALQFMIGEYTVTLNTATMFIDGTCSTVGAGRRVYVRGTMTGARTVTASKIAFKN